MIKEIQSGNIAALDINKINTSLSAMVAISQVVPVINKSLKVLQDNDKAAKKLNVDIRNIQNAMVNTIQTGNYSQFVQALPGFQANVPAMSGTQSITSF